MAATISADHDFYRVYQEGDHASWTATLGQQWSLPESKLQYIWQRSATVIIAITACK